MLSNLSQHSIVLIGVFAREQKHVFFFFCLEEVLAARSFSFPSLLSKHILVLLEKEEKNANVAGKSSNSLWTSVRVPGC